MKPLEPPAVPGPLDPWQQAYLDSLTTAQEELVRACGLSARVVGVDWGSSPSRTATVAREGDRTLFIIDEVGEVPASLYEAPTPRTAVVGGRRGGKWTEAERAAGVVRLVELSPGVWGRR